MKYNFCTLFDSFYLTRGIALYRSLETYCDDFQLYIFAFDNRSFEILEKLNLKYATIISLKDFENEDLIRVKPTRTIAEYCWTCTASIIWYSIKNFNLDHCTYLDADILFFSSPEPVFDEIGRKSVGITPHNFSERFKSSEIYGKYCVQFTYFKNDDDGLKALKWWKDSCINWCYAKMVDGKYGDQKYLDYFETKFNNVCVISHYGAGVAPWNISNYKFEIFQNSLIVQKHKEIGKKSLLIFYHYQGLKFQENGSIVIVEPSVLNIPEYCLDLIYKPYIEQLISIKNQIESTPLVYKDIIFQRKLVKSIFTAFRINLKRFWIIRKFYYHFLKSRYNKPINIGGTLN